MRTIPFAGCLRPAPHKIRKGDLVLVGLPDDSRSSFKRGAAQAPAAIRELYDGACYNSTTESGVNLHRRVFDLGDWAPGKSWQATLTDYRKRASKIFSSGAVPFFLGGDHAVTVPIVQALSASAQGDPVDVIQIDAHSDLYADYQGDPWSHACVAARILELENVRSVTQIGVRTLNPEQSTAARRSRHRLDLHTAGYLNGRLPYPARPDIGARVYLTLDIDALDPAFAPGVSHPVPGGLSSRQLLDWIRGFPYDLLGMDVVEVNPVLDERGRTAVLAGRLLHEAMGLATGEARPSR